MLSYPAYLFYLLSFEAVVQGVLLRAEPRTVDREVVGRRRRRRRRPRSRFGSGLLVLIGHCRQHQHWKKELESFRGIRTRVLGSLFLF